jgi:hypothetical protein
LYILTIPQSLYALESAASVVSLNTSTKSVILLDKREVKKNLFTKLKLIKELRLNVLTTCLNHSHGNRSYVSDLVPAAWLKYKTYYLISQFLVQNLIGGMADEKSMK